MAKIGRINNGEASRTLLPQISLKELAGYVRHLQDCGIDVAAKYTGVHRLRPVQKEYNRKKVDELKKVENDIKSQPLIVSKENYIMDGHHRWIALSELNEKYPIRVVQVNLPITELVKRTRDYSGSSIKTVKEARIRLKGLITEYGNEIPLNKAVKNIDRQIEDLKQQKKNIMELRVPINRVIRRWNKFSKLSDRQMKNEKWKKFKADLIKETQKLEDKLINAGLISRGDNITWDLAEIK